MSINLNIGDTNTIIEECKSQKLTLQQTAYILATTYHETAFTMKPVKEAFWLSESARKRALRKYYPWYGRGYVQLTWKDNYVRAGKELGVDLTSDPDKVLEPAIAAKVLVIGSQRGWFTGKKLSDYINENHADYLGARRIINGTDKKHTIAKYAYEYERLLKEDGYSLNTSNGSGNILETLIRLLALLFGGKNGVR